jgi:hypothetical protein
MVEQHVNSGSDMLGCALIHCIEHPNGFHEHKMGNPRSA